MLTTLKTYRRSFSFLFVLACIAGLLFVGPLFAQAEEPPHIPFEERVEMALCEAEGVQPEEIAEFNRIYRKLSTLGAESDSVVAIFLAESEASIEGAEYAVMAKYIKAATRVAEMQSRMLARMIEYLKKHEGSVSEWQIPPPPMTPLP